MCEFIITSFVGFHIIMLPHQWWRTLIEIQRGEYSGNTPTLSPIMHIQVSYQCFQVTKETGEPPASLLTVTNKSVDQTVPSVFGFDAPTRLQPVIQHQWLMLSKDILENYHWLMATSLSILQVATTVLWYQMATFTIIHRIIVANSNSTLPEPVVNGTKHSPSPAIPTKSLYAHEWISPTSRPPHLRLSWQWHRWGTNH